MRDRMERLVVLPFSIGCVSNSSVAVAQSIPRRTKPDPNRPPAPKKEGCIYEGRTQNSVGFLPLQKANFSASLNRLTKSFKNFSQFFVYKEGEEMEEVEMEIGYPTDVKHVTHIGWDGPTTMMKGWDDLLSRPLPAINSTTHLDLVSMPAAQPDHLSLHHCNG